MQPEHDAEERATVSGREAHVVLCGSSEEATRPIPNRRERCHGACRVPESLGWLH